jgi:hypothetical protein
MIGLVAPLFRDSHIAPLAHLLTYRALTTPACGDFHRFTALINSTSFIIFLIKFKTLLLMKLFIRSFPQRQ